MGVWFRPMDSPADLLDPRELRLRRQIDRLIDRLAEADRRIVTLEARNGHLNRRLIALSEDLREARSAA